MSEFPLFDERPEDTKQEKAGHSRKRVINAMKQWKARRPRRHSFVKWRRRVQQEIPNGV